MYYILYIIVNVTLLYPILVTFMLYDVLYYIVASHYTIYILTL